MTDSFRKIDYRLRPAKHAERCMLVDMVKRMRFGPLENYRYLGLGSVAFIDHRMMHRATGVSDMISLEGADDPVIQQRFLNNVPLGCIDMRFGMSYDLLPEIDVARPSIIWLDYDDQMARWMINDLEIVGRDIAPGSFVAVTFATSFPTEGPKRTQELERLRNDFPEYISDETKPAALEGPALAEIGRTAFGSFFARALSDADVLKAENEKRRLEQVCYFRYKDGANMCTVGWMVITDQTEGMFKDATFEALPFFRSTNDPFNIRIPKVTPLEVREIERRLPNWEAEEITWIPPADRRDFAALYRYLPMFATIEPT